MCRMVAYFGPAILAADVVTRPSRSIIRQSYDARERLCSAGEYVPASLNGDGYGIGWYSDDGVPCVYKSIRPAWNDANLHHLAEKGIRSHLLFAHVRAATAGTSVTEESCHPFAYGRYLFQHNGTIAGWHDGRVRRALLNQLNDELYGYAVRNGASDSIVAFALFLNQMDRGTSERYSAAELQEMLLHTIALIVETTTTCLLGTNSPCSDRTPANRKSMPRDDVFLLNFLVTDGETLLATKYVRGLRDLDAPAASLYFGAASSYGPVTHHVGTGAEDYAFSYRAATWAGVVVVASEPLTSNPCDWVPLPRNSILVATADRHLLVEKMPDLLMGRESPRAGSSLSPKLLPQSSALVQALHAFAGSTATRSIADRGDPLPPMRSATAAAHVSWSRQQQHQEQERRKKPLLRSSQQELNSAGSGAISTDLIEIDESDRLFTIRSSRVLCMTTVPVQEDVLPQIAQELETMPLSAATATSGRSGCTGSLRQALLVCGTGDSHMYALHQISGLLASDSFVSADGRDILGIARWQRNNLAAYFEQKGMQPSATFTVCAAADNTVRMHRWTVDGIEEIANFFCGTATGHPLCLVTDQSAVYLGFQDCSVRRLDMQGLLGTVKVEPEARPEGAAHVPVLSEQALFRRLGQRGEHSDLARASQHCGPVYCLALHSKTRRLFSGSGDGTIAVWNTESEEHEATLRGHCGAVLALKLDENVDILFSGARDRRIRVWDVARSANYVCRRILLSWDYHCDDICALELSESFLFSASTDGVVVLWSRPDLAALALLRLPSGTLLTSLCVTPDASAMRPAATSDAMSTSGMLFAATSDGSVYGWHLGASGSLYGRIYGTDPADLEGTSRVPTKTLPTTAASSCAGSLEAATPNSMLFSLSSPRIRLGDPEWSSVAAFERALRTAIRFRSIAVDTKQSNFREESFHCARWFSRLLENLGADLRIAQPVDGKNPVILARFVDIIGCKGHACRPGPPAFPSSLARARVQHRHTVDAAHDGEREHQAQQVRRQHFRQTVVFYGHYDVVPAHREDGWSHDPFDLQVSNGYFYGRGCTDNKGPILAMIFAIVDLLQEQQQWRHQQRNIPADHELAPRTAANTLTSSTRTVPPPAESVHAAVSAGACDNIHGACDDFERSTNVVLLLDGEGEASSAGFRETIALFRDWIVGKDLDQRQAGQQLVPNGDPRPAPNEPVPQVVCVLHANSLWVDDVRPCITYGMRGQILLSVEITGPSGNLHSGFDGGAVLEPAADLLAILATLSDAGGTARVPGFYDDVRELTPSERSWLSAVHFDRQAYLQHLGVSRLAADNDLDLLQKRWCQPCLSITELSTSANAVANGAAAAARSSTGRLGAISALIPQRAQATVAIRTVPNQSPEKLRAAVEQHLHFEFAKRRSPNQLRITCTKQGDWWLGDIHGERYPSSSSSSSSSTQVEQRTGCEQRARQRVFAVSERAIERVWGVQPLYVREGGSMPLTAWLEQTLEAPAIHLPLGQSSDAPHLPNERIRVLNLFHGRMILGDIVRSLAVQ